MGGGQMETPRRLLADAGQENRYAIAAGVLSIAPFEVHRQILRLRLTFGLTQDQAALIAALAFGGAS